MTHELMVYLLDGVLKQHVAIIESFCLGISDAEFNKIPTIWMSEDQRKVIESYATVMYPIRNGTEGDDYKDFAIYSVGGAPFKIKTLNSK